MRACQWSMEETQQTLCAVWPIWLCFVNVVFGKKSWSKNIKKLQVITSLLCLLAMDFAPPAPPVIEGTSLTERLLAAQADDLTLQVCCTLHQKILSMYDHWGNLKLWLYLSCTFVQLSSSFVVSLARFLAAELEDESDRPCFLVFLPVWKLYLYRTSCPWRIPFLPTFSLMRSSRVSSLCCQQE